MASSAANPFLDPPASRWPTGSGGLLRPVEATLLAALVEAGPEPVVVRGCGSGCGLTHFLTAATAPWPAVTVCGGLRCGWPALRAEVESAPLAGRLVPALLGRWLAAAVRCGDLPSTDPELVAMQCEREPDRMLDFATPSPAARWLVAAPDPARAVLARHCRLGTGGRRLLDAALAWGARRGTGPPAGWRVAGDNDQDAVSLLAAAAQACGLPLLWVFDALDDLALRLDAVGAFWSFLASLHAAGGRIVIAAQDDVWRTCLEPPLPSAWRRRLAARTVVLAPLPPPRLVDLLNDRLSPTQTDLTGLAAHVVTTTFPLGGLPQDALAAAAACWAARHTTPIEPAPLPAALPARGGGDWVDALVAAGAALPFVEVVPLSAAGLGRAVLWQLPGQWILLVATDGLCAAAREAAEAQASALRAAAPAGTRVELAALVAGDASGPRWPQPWNTIMLEGDEAGRLADLPRIPAGPDRFGAVAALQPLWERLTRRGRALA